MIQNYDAIFVDVERLGIEDIRQHFIEHPHLYETSDNYNQFQEFLSSITSQKPIIGNGYIYAAISFIPAVRLCYIDRFNEPKELINYKNNDYYFDDGILNIKCPSGKSTKGEYLIKSFLFSSLDDFIQMKTELILRFSDWKISEKVIGNNKAINEMVDQPYRYMLTKQTTEGRQYLFTTDSGTKIIVSLALEKLSNGNTRVEVAFAEHSPEGNNIKATGKGDAFKIFSTVASIVKEFLNKTKLPIEQLTFTSDSTEPSRVKLYNHISKSLGKFIHGFKLLGSGSNGVDTVYYFEKAA